MSDATQVAFQVDNERLAEIDELLRDKESDPAPKPSAPLSGSSSPAAAKSAPTPGSKPDTPRCRRVRRTTSGPRPAARACGRPTSGGDRPRRGEIWPAEIDKVRPVVVVHRDCIASLDNLSLVLRTDLVRRIDALDASRMQELCRALAVAVAYT